MSRAEPSRAAARCRLSRWRWARPTPRPTGVLAAQGFVELNPLAGIYPEATRLAESGFPLRPTEPQAAPEEMPVRPQPCSCSCPSVCRAPVSATPLGGSWCCPRLCLGCCGQSPLRRLLSAGALAASEALFSGAFELQMFPHFTEDRVCVCALHFPSCFCMISQSLRREERSLRHCLKSELQTWLGKVSGAGGGQAQECQRAQVT